MAVHETASWREAERALHEAHRDATAAAIAALLEVSEIVGSDFAVSNALTRLERLRNEAEQAAKRV